MSMLLERRHPLPLAVDIEDLVGRLLEREVTVSNAAVPLPDLPVTSSIYRRDDGELAGMLIADVGFTNCAGAALALMPPAKAQEATERGEVDAGLLTNFREVANVASRWFNGPDWPHVVLASVHGLGERTPTGTMVFRFAPRARRDYRVTIEGYGEGRLSVLSN